LAAEVNPCKVNHLNCQSIAGESSERSHVVRVGLGTGKEWLQESGLAEVIESASFDPVYATRLMVDVLPNPWVAWTEPP
jgi:hypothetical protein